MHSQLLISRISILVSSTSNYFYKEKARKANTNNTCAPSDVLKSSSSENPMKHYLLSQTNSKFCQRADYYRVFQILSVQSLLYSGFSANPTPAFPNSTLFRHIGNTFC